MMFKILCLLFLVSILDGCGGGSGDLSSLFGGSSSGSGFSSGSGSSGSSGGSSGSGSSGSGGVTLAHSPEPTTLALFGIGLAGLALARRRKGKK